MNLNKILNKQTLVSTYVHLGSKLIDVTVNPLNRFMKHLLVVQGLDPNAAPGAAFRKKLVEAVNQVDDKKDFDDDFDFSWVGKSFFKAKSKLKDLNINKNDFKRLTDLSLLNDVPEKPIKGGLSPLEDEELLEPTLIRNALRSLEKYAAQYDTESAVAYPSKHLNTLNNKKVNKPLKTIKKKGSFRRVNNDK